MQKLIDAILDASGMVTTVLTALITVLLLYEVIVRYVFQSPSMWALDITQYTICYLTFIGAAWLLREEGHIKVELLKEYVSPRAWALVEAVTSVVACLACAVFCWQTTKMALSAYQTGQFIDASFVMPRFLVVGIMPIGLFLLCIELTRKARQHFHRFMHYEEVEVKGPRKGPAIGSEEGGGL
jgi:C4-dicarboxylate transporter, DctQ subunit